MGGAGGLPRSLGDDTPATPAGCPLGYDMQTGLYTLLVLTFCPKYHLQLQFALFLEQGACIWLSPWPLSLISPPP